MTSISISAALSDRNLLGAALADMTSWSTWLSVLKASFGDALSTREREVFARVGGNRSPPTQMVRELWAIIGRRGGKSRIAAAKSAYMATCIDHSGKLSPSETDMVLVLASTTSQAKAVFNYILAFIQASPVLAQQIETVTANEIRLRGDIEIAVHTNSFRSIRGRTLLAVVFDEVGFWRDETSSQPDIETYRAILPALATTQGMLTGISSPYRRIGLLHQKHRDYFGVDDPDTLVVQGPTIAFNPTISTAIVDRARRGDPTSALVDGMQNSEAISRNFSMTIQLMRRLIMVDLWNYRRGRGFSIMLSWMRARVGMMLFALGLFMRKRLRALMTIRRDGLRAATKSL